MNLDDIEKLVDSIVDNAKKAREPEDPLDAIPTTQQELLDGVITSEVYMKEILPLAKALQEKCIELGAPVTIATFSRDEDDNLGSHVLLNTGKYCPRNHLFSQAILEMREAENRVARAFSFPYKLVVYKTVEDTDEDGSKFWNFKLQGYVDPIDNKQEEEAHE